MTEPVLCDWCGQSIVDRFHLQGRSCVTYLRAQLAAALAAKQAAEEARDTRYPNPLSINFGTSSLSVAEFHGTNDFGLVISEHELPSIDELPENRPTKRSPQPGETYLSFTNWESFWTVLCTLAKSGGILLPEMQAAAERSEVAAARNATLEAALRDVRLDIESRAEYGYGGQPTHLIPLIDAALVQGAKETH